MIIEDRYALRALFQQRLRLFKISLITSGINLTFIWKLLIYIKEYHCII